MDGHSIGHMWAEPMEVICQDDVEVSSAVGTKKRKRSQGRNCVLPNCSKHENSPGIKMFKVPNNKRRRGLCTKDWSDQFKQLLFRYRDPKDNKLKERLEAGKVFICSFHFDESQIIRTTYRTNLKHGALPIYHLPIKTHEPTTSAPRVTQTSLKAMDREFQSANVSSEDEAIGITTSSPLTAPKYMNITEVRNAFTMLKDVDGWIIQSYGDMQLHFAKWDSNNLRLSKYSLVIKENLEIAVYIKGVKLPTSHQFFDESIQSGESIYKLLKRLEKLELCFGYEKPPGSDWSTNWIPISAQCGEEWPPALRYLHKQCLIGILDSLTPCSECKQQYHHRIYLDARREDRNNDLMDKPLHPSSTLNTCSIDRIKSTLKSSINRIKELELEVKEKGRDVSTELSEAISEIMSKNPEDEFLKTWWTVQSKLRQVAPSQRRYPPSVINYCLRLHGKSPASYKVLQEVLILPSPTLLRKTRNESGSVMMGLQKSAMNRLKQHLSNTTRPHERNAVLIIDEMTISETLVYRRYKNDIVGYVDFGNEAHTTLREKDTSVANHVLAFYLRGVTNRKLDGVIAFYTTNGVQSKDLILLLYECIGDLHMESSVNIQAIIGDGLSANRTAFKMMANEEEIGQYFRFCNPFGTNWIYFIQDPPHLIKTVRNNLMNEKRLLWNEEFMTWEPIKNMIMNDMKLGDLRFFPKLTIKHCSPNVWERMNVRMAAQVLSETVGMELKRQGHEKLSEFVLLIDKWFDLMNTGLRDYKKKLKPNMAPFRNNQETKTRLDWLMADFLTYFANWKSHVKTNTITKTNKSKMLLSSQTEEGLVMTTKSMVALIKDNLDMGAEYIITRRLNQDPLEAHFGYQRTHAHRKNTPSALDFGYNTRILSSMRTSLPLPGSNVSV